VTGPDSAERSHRPRVISLPNSLLRTFAPLNTHPDPRLVPYQIPGPTVALCSPKTADEIRVEANPPLLRRFVTVSDLPIFPLLLRSRRDPSFPFSCSLFFPNPRRTSCRATVRPLPSQARVGLRRFQPWPQVSSHRAPPRSGAFDLVSRALNRSNRKRRPTPAMAPLGSASAPAGQLPLPPHDLISTVHLKSNGSNQKIPFRLHFLQKNPPAFKVLTCKPSAFLKIRFLNWITYFRAVEFKIRFQYLQNCH